MLSNSQTPKPQSNILTFLKFKVAECLVFLGFRFPLPSFEQRQDPDSWVQEMEGQVRC